MTAASEELVQAVGGEDGERAVRALYRAHAGELFGFAVHRLGDRGLAEELVQDVFTRVWRHADEFDPTQASFRTWLFAIARNAIVDLERRRAVRPPAPPAAAAEEREREPERSSEPIEQALLRWQIRAALERLTPEHREVIRLAHFEGLTLREIAARTEVPLGTVKSRTSYALGHLRLALEEMGVSP